MTTIRQPFGADPSPYSPLTSVNVGTAGTGVTATEYGDASHHRTVLTIAATSPAIGGGAALAIGNLIYTFPAGEIVIQSVTMKVGVDGVTGNHADVIDIGLGTTIASGVTAVLSASAAFENVQTGITAAAAGVVVPGTTTAPFSIPTANDHTLYQNVAATWTGADPGMAVAGRVEIDWVFLGA